MIAMLDLHCETYIYAQNLDNLGGTEYWRITKNGSISEKLLPNAPSLSAIRSQIDIVQSEGKLWQIGDNHLICRIIRGGNCVLMATPETKDCDGRHSPVLVLFNALGPSRQQAAIALMSIPSLMGREMWPNYKNTVNRLRLLTSLPRWITSLHITIFSRKVNND